jgi:hypothetical protein
MLRGRVFLRLNIQEDTRRFAMKQTKTINPNNIVTPKQRKGLSRRDASTDTAGNSFVAYSLQGDKQQ